MPDEMRVQPFERLLAWMLREREVSSSIFGIPEALFYRPAADDPYVTEMFGDRLATPIGPAAGPHTQLAQNIVSAWLSGGRFIELKTVQVMDDLQIGRPCIDMADEGYNVEWSQELRLGESAREYVNAWVLIHVLRRILGFEGAAPLGTIFNMSVGYDLAGITSPAVTRFMDRMVDAGPQIEEIRSGLRDRFPCFADLEIPPRLVNSVTLSTMHGCPPDEIERIAEYLLEERGLHTTVKLNPTLLGKDTVLRILHDALGFQEIGIPDAVFDKDLQYDRALGLIRRLKDIAARCGLSFGVKLSNTLPVANHRGVLPGEEMYLSGRALYPITMTLFHRLVEAFDGELDVSYAGGADALNVPEVLACGARPVTVASDLLRPGGYSRLLQSLERVRVEMTQAGADSLQAFAAQGRDHLARAAAAVVKAPRYHKTYRPEDLPKVPSTLEPFDCIAAPCTAACAVCQDVPEYAGWIAAGRPDEALRGILARNPLPGVTGYVCTHLCQSRCTRNNTDESVAIRALKRYAAERGKAALPWRESTGRRVAVIGAGPSGLAAAAFLAMNGVSVELFEEKDRPGGMLALAPAFRLPSTVVKEDIDRILALGVTLRTEHGIASRPEALLEDGYDAVYVATGFPHEATLAIPGIDGGGVVAALDLLAQVSRGEVPELGERVVVIGGGNTAMDAARTAARLIGGPVTVLYRRSRREMPAQPEEIDGLLAEGNRLEELVSPVRILREDGRVAGVECVRNRLGEPGPDGRRRPVSIEGSTFTVPATCVVVAVGQRPEVSFLEESGVTLAAGGRIAVDEATGACAARGVYAGGDAVRGPAIIIEACADGQRAAEAICAALGIDFDRPQVVAPDLPEAALVAIKRARARQMPRIRPERGTRTRGTFDVIEPTLSEEEAVREAGRCVQCRAVCDKCVEVCPNRANQVYQVVPGEWTLPVLALENGRLATVGQEDFGIAQARQIVHIDDLCNACGNCATFCVHDGEPYRDKPCLVLDEAAFHSHEGTAYHLQLGVILRRSAGRESRLTVSGAAMIYEDDDVRLVLSRGFEVREASAKRAVEGTISVRSVVEMAVLARGIATSLPFLVVEA
jgi:putative selenate reductase